MMATWLIVWLLAFVAVLPLGSAGVVAGVLLIVSFFWTFQVLSNVCHVTTAGLASRWYFDKQMDAPVGTALKHAWSYQFGSICLGSLLVAVIQTLGAMARAARDNGEGNIVTQILSCVAICILQCLESLLKLFNTFAFNIVAIYSVPFCRAGREVSAL